MDNKIKVLVVGLVLLVVAVVATFLFLGTDNKEPREDDYDFPFSIWIALWVVIFLPMMAKKRKEPTPEEKRRLKYLTLIGVIACAVSCVVALSLLF